MNRSAQSFVYTSHDDLRLHALDVRPEIESARTPVVCLAGLTRSAVDFETLAEALADDGRRVVAFDYRGRGESAHDPDWHHYDIATERADLLLGLSLMGIERAHFVGTSRGGLHIMAMASTHRAMIASAIFNDIGPKLEVAGLQRIKGYVGKAVTPRSLDEAIRILKIGVGAHFESLTPREWRIFATTTFGTDETDLRMRYDPALTRALDVFDLDKPLPETWDLFDLLHGLPVLTIRGDRSDLLSAATLDAMGARWRASETFVVPGQGHAPLLADAASIAMVRGFIARADETHGDV